MSSNAQAEELVLTWSTPSREMRAGHAFRATSSPTAAGHAATIAGIEPVAPNRRSS